MHCIEDSSLLVYYSLLTRSSGNSTGCRWPVTAAVKAVRMSRDPHTACTLESCSTFAVHECRVGDCFYVPPDTFDQVENPDEVKPELPAYLAKSRFHKGGANAGLRAFGIAKLLGLKKTQGQASGSLYTKDK